MSILKVIKRVIMVCDIYDKDVKDIDIVDGLLITTLTNGVKFTLAYRFMTKEQLTANVIAACCWRC